MITMRVPCVLLVCVIALVSGQVDEYDEDVVVDSNFADNSSYVRCPCEESFSCYCVQHFQCLANGTINYEGAERLISFRQADLRPITECTDDEVCCKDTKAQEEKAVPKTTTRPPSPQNGCGMKGSYSSILEKNIQASPGEFPWMLAIFSTDGIEWQFRCGASLLSKNVALTAAHCVKEFESKPWVVSVRAGVWDLSVEYEEGEEEENGFQELDVGKVIVHEEYVEKKLHNDIALLIMDGNFRRTSTVDIVCIPPKRNLFQDGSSCTATGWGRRKFGSTRGERPQLKKITVPLVSRDACQTKLRNIMRKTFRLHDSFICAGGKTRMDSCTGDGGGPLVCEVNGYYVQVGIVSWGVGCGRNNLPGVYVDVAKYLQWIQEAIKRWTI